jgi:hypothetical protein
MRKRDESNCVGIGQSQMRRRNCYVEKSPVGLLVRVRERRWAVGVEKVRFRCGFGESQR